MSNNIDERVVEMRFDNQHFEKNVSTTMSTLDKFKEKLKFTGATAGLDNISDAAKKVNITPLANAAETVRLKFSALEVMAVTALQNITNSAINAGKKIVSSLTIDPIKTGFQEYETQINSVQTILANTESKGTTLEQVNSALDELNTYADKTIYNFTQMTRNIGTFTAAGVDLETSVAAIKGIANLAAVSGSTSQQASTAMYQLSQALSSGTVKLMDWNSVVNAGMGGQVFQDALKETARLHGIAIDQMIKDEGSFRNTLSNGWLSSEILTETLAKFTGDLSEAQLKAMGYNDEQIAGILKLGKTANDAATKVKTFTQLMDTLKESAQSGWSQTWKILIGDFEEAKELFTEVSDAFGKIIGDASDARNNLLKGALSSKWGELEEQITSAGISFDDFQEKLKETAKSHGVSIEEMIEKEGSLEKTLKSGWLTSGILSETLRGYTKDLDGTNQELLTLSENLTKFGDVIDQVILGNFGNGETRVKLLTEAGYDYETIQDLVNKTLNGTAEELKNLSEEQLKNLGLTEEQISALHLLAEEAEKSGTSLNKLIGDLTKPTGRELLIDTVRNALKGLGKILGAIGKAWREAFPPMTSEQLYNIIDAVHKLSQKLDFSEDSVSKLTRTFKGLFAILDVITTFTGGAFKMALKVVAKVLGLVDVPLIDVTAHVGDLLVKFRDWLFTNSILAKGFNAVVEAVGNAVDAFKTWITGFDSLSDVQTRFEKFVSTFKDFAEKGLSKIKEFSKRLVDGAKKVKAWIDEFMAVTGVQAALDKFKIGCGEVLASVKESLEKSKNSFVEFIDKVKSLDSITFKDVLNALKEFGKKVINNFSNIGGSFTTVTDAINDFKEEVKLKLGETWAGFDEFLTKIAGFGESIKDRLGEIDLGGIILAALGIGTLTVGSKIGDALEALTAPLSGFGELLKGLAFQTKQVSGVLKAARLTILAGGFVALAAGIILLAGAVALLTLIDQNKLWSATLAMAFLGVVLIGIAAAMALMNKGIQNVNANITSLIAIAGAVLILVLALKMMDSLKPDRVLTNVLALGAIMAGLFAVALVLSKKAPQMISGSATLIAFSVAVLILVEALKSIAKIKTNNVMSSVTALLGIIAGLIALTVMCRGVDKGGAITALAAAIALKILVGVIKDYANIKMETILSALISLLPIIGMFALVMQSTKLAGKHAAKAGAAILLISAALILMVTAIKQLTNIPIKSLLAPMAVITVLMALIAGLIAVSKFAGKNAVKAGAMLLMVAGALTILAILTVVLSKIDPEGLAIGIAAIAALTTLLAGLMYMTKYVKALKGAKSMLIILTVVVGLLAAALVVLGSMNQKDVLAATVAMSAVMGMFALLMSTVSTLKNIGKKALPTIALLTLVVVALGAVLYFLGGLKPESSLASAIGLSVLITALVQACKNLMKIEKFSVKALLSVAALALIVAGLGEVLYRIQGMDPLSTIGTATALSELILVLAQACKMMQTVQTVSGKALLSIAALALIVAGLGVVLYYIQGMDPESTIATATGLASLLYTLAIVCKVLTPVGTAATAALKGIGVLAVLIVAMGALMVAIGALVTYVSDVGTWIDAAIPIFEKIGYGIGAFVGGIVGGLAAGVLSGLPAIATYLSQFMENIQPFFKGITAISGEIVTSALNLVAIILAITAATLLNQITSFLTGGRNIISFAAQLTALGTGIVAFSKIVSGNVDTEAVEAATNAGKLLTELANTVPNSGGLLGFIVGNNDIGDFAAQLPVLGAGLATFSNTVKGNVDADAVETAANAGKMLTALADTVPNSGGLLGFIVGNNDIGYFASQLPILGVGIAAFSQIVSVAGINTEAVEAATSAGKMLTALADTVPNTGGLISFIVGDNNIDDFAKQLPTLAVGIVAFSQLVSYGGINTEAVNSAVSVGMLLTELANTVPNTGGLIDFLVGGNDIGKFAAQLPLLGTGIVAFSQLVSYGGIDTKAVDTATNAGKLLVELANTVPNSDGIFDFIGRRSDISAFVSELPLLATGIVAFSQLVSYGGIDTAAVEAATSAGKMLSELSANVNENKTGGLLSFLGGGNMATFAAQLPILGDGLVQFSSKVSGKVDTDAVATAANAGQMLAALSSNITESTGNWFYNLFGGNNNKFKNFKEQMPLLGEAIVAFSDKISGKIDSGAVTAAKTVSDVLAVLSANMTASSVKQISNFNKTVDKVGDSLIKLYNDLTSLNLGTLIATTTKLTSVINTAISWTNAVDTKRMTGFGSALYSLGSKIRLYYKQLIGIDINDFRAVLNVIRDMVNLTIDMSNVNTAAVDSFTESLSNLGKKGVSAFVKAFEDSEEQIKGAATGMMSTFSEAISGDTSAISTSFSNIITTMLNQINGTQKGGTGVKNQESFRKAGETLIAKFGIGISNNTSTTVVETAIGTIITTAANKLGSKETYDKFVSSGKYVVRGFAAGIESTESKNAVSSAVYTIGRLASSGLNNSLEVRSPSRVTYETGEFMGMGLVNGIMDYADKSYNAGAGLADSAKTGLSNAIAKVVDTLDDEVGTEPTIRPVLDLTDVESGAKKLNTMFAQSQVMSIDVGNHNNLYDNQNGVTGDGKYGNTYQFTQNNYSPKALSRIDIYRQTKNQFSAMERMVER